MNNKNAELFGSFPLLAVVPDFRALAARLLRLKVPGCFKHYIFVIFDRRPDPVEKNFTFGNSFPIDLTIVNSWGLLVMMKILDAAARFRADVFEKSPLYSKLQNGQSPEVAFIACSDSRVVPNALTGTDPGQLFVLRNAGNLVANRFFSPNGEAASLEYAVEVLKVRHIVVCGHTRCGAVQYLLEQKDSDDCKLAWVSSWLVHARELHSRLEKRALNRENILRAAVEENVMLQMDHLLSYRFISKKVAEGGLQLHGWVYEIESGNVSTRRGSEFVLLTPP